MANLRGPRRVDGVVVETVGDERFVFNPADETMHALNAPAARVLDACNGERTVEEIGQKVAVKGLSAEMVQLGLVELDQAGLIESVPDVDAPTRRELLIKLGAGAAAVAAIPVIESILAPTAAAASSAPSPSPTPTPSPSPSPTPTPSPSPSPTPTPSPSPCSSVWDKSSYSAAAINCSTGTAEVCNTGSGTATCPVYFKVWYSYWGNPKRGHVVKRGHISALGATNSCGTVDFSAAMKNRRGRRRKGNYKVQFFQHEGHPGGGSTWTPTGRCW